MELPQDFQLNGDMSFSKAIRCHDNLDFACSVQGDILLTATNGQAVLNKIYLLMKTKPGEVPNEPQLGWVLHKYFYKPATGNTFAMLEREMKFQFDALIPELGIKSLKCAGMGNDYGRVDGVQITIISNDYGKIVLTADRSLSNTTVIPEEYQ